MMMHEYVAEKLRALEEERLAHLHYELPPRKPVLAAVIRTAGRRLRQTGERLESWATPAPVERDQRPLGSAWRER